LSDTSEDGSIGQVVQGITADISSQELFDNSIPIRVVNKTTKPKKKNKQQGMLPVSNKPMKQHIFDIGCSQQSNDQNKGRNDDGRITSAMYNNHLLHSGGSGGSSSSSSSSQQGESGSSSSSSSLTTDTANNNISRRNVTTKESQPTTNRERRIKNFVDQLINPTNLTTKG